MNYTKLIEGSQTEDQPSPVNHVWNPNLYKLQQEAPKPKPVTCMRHIMGQPSYYGSEFHGVLSSQEAVSIVTEEGAYLVRLSAKTNTFYTLSLRFDGKLKHFKLYYDGHHYVKEKRFDSVGDLVRDGLVTLYMETKAGSYIELMHNLNSYEKSPYMTLNKLKRRAAIAKSCRKEENHDEPDSKSTNGGHIVETTPGVLEPEIVEYSKPHHFKVHTFKGLTWCEFCGNFLWGFTAQGVKCDDCGFSAHSKCSEKLPQDCCPDLKQLRGVFGIDLTTLVKARRTVRPFVVDRCVQEIERRGVQAEGLYRISGFAEEIEALKMALDRDGEKTDMSPAVNDNINVIAGTLKLYLRLLPIPLVTFDTHPALINATQLKTLEDRKRGIRDALTLLPPAHYNTLKHLMEHLNRVVAYKEVNKMTPLNLSTVFAPTLMPPPHDLTKVVGLPAMTHEISALETIISYPNEIFTNQS